MAPDNAGPEEVLVTHPLYKITRRRKGEFQILKVTGRYADALLEDLRAKVFLYKHAE